MMASVLDCQDGDRRIRSDGFSRGIEGVREAVFTVYRSNRTEKLVDALAGVLERPLDDPMKPEIIAVQSLGMRKWLGQELSRRLGIWANARFPFPKELVQRLIADVLSEPAPERDPFQDEVLTWAIMECLPGLLEQPGFEPLRDYLLELGTVERSLKQYQLSLRIAHVFDQYLVYRPRMLLGWESSTAEDWQPVLFRTLVARLGGEHLPARWRRFERALRDGREKIEKLPRRICLFGISSLPPLYLDVLARLPDEVEVHLFLFAPTRPHLEQGHPLLASLGELGWDFSRSIEELVQDVQDDARVDLFEDPEDRNAPSLLRAIQSDIFNIRRRPSAGVRIERLDPDDRSIAILSCHSPMREVEALHEQLRDLFESDSTLQPHDVIVMTPDIEAYSPLIEAVFSSSTGGPLIPYSISDRSPRFDSAVVDAFAALMDLASSRLGLIEVFDLLSMEPVRERFSISADDLDLARHWAREAGVRWGIDVDHRRALGQEAFAQNTWRFGLDRLLLGYALPGDERVMFGGCLPYDEVEGKQAEVLGRLVEFCERLFSGLSSPVGERTWPEWERVLSDLLRSMIASDRTNVHQHQFVREALRDSVAAAAKAGFSGKIGLDVVGAYLDERFGQTFSARGFLSGGVTFCNLLPMRSIPFRVICLMGMNDGQFPRDTGVLGFDLIARDPKPGDRSVRADDRYLFLEVLLSARERLVVSYVGQSIQDNSPIPPSVVVSELTDVIAEGFFVDGEGCTREETEKRLVVKHPLQPFNPRYFGAGDDRRLISYQRDFFEGAQAMVAGPRQAAPFLTGPLPTGEDGPDVISILDLKRFFRMPAAFLLQRRLGVHLREYGQEDSEREPIELDALESYEIGQWLLDRALDDPGVPLDSLRPILRAKGVLPPGSPGDLVFASLAGTVGQLVAAFRQSVKGDRAETREVALSLGSVTLTGSLAGLRPEVQARATYGALNAGRLLDLWIDHLVLNCLNCLNEGDLPKVSYLVARAKKRADAVRLAGLDGEQLDLLDELLRLYRRGQHEPLRFFPETSLAYVQKLRKVADDPEQARQAARSKWRPGYSHTGEQDEPSVSRLFGHTDPLTDESGEASLRFEALARRVLDPLLDCLDKGGKP